MSKTKFKKQNKWKTNDKSKVVVGAYLSKKEAGHIYLPWTAIREIDS